MELYLDNAATTYPKPESVYIAMDRFAREEGGSSGRSGHHRALAAGRAVMETREEIARLAGLSDPLRVVFTKNATEALNTAIRGMVGEGDHVVTSAIEHNSVIRLLHAMEREGLEFSVVPCSLEGQLDTEDVIGALRDNTRLVVLNHASNVAGTILPVEEAGRLLRERGIPLLVDAAQTIGRLPMDMEAAGISLLAFTGHKELFGPQGTGGLCVAEGWKPRTLIFGGTGSRSEQPTQPDFFPDCLEAGTLNAHGLVGLGAGVRFILEKGVDEIRDHELSLNRLMWEGLNSLPRVKVYGPEEPEARVGIFSVTFDSLSPPEATEILDREYGICARSGLHCSPLSHRTLGTLDTGTLRFGTSYFNKEGDVRYLVKCLREILS